jgi:hypothetical protein
MTQVVFKPELMEPDELALAMDKCDSKVGKAIWKKFLKTLFATKNFKNGNLGINYKYQLSKCWKGSIESQIQEKYSLYLCNLLFLVFPTILSILPSPKFSGY